MSSKYVKMDFRLVEYADDEDTKLREIDFSSFGSGARMLADKAGFKPHEIPAFTKIMEGLRELSEEPEPCEPS